MGAAPSHIESGHASPNGKRVLWTRGMPQQPLELCWLALHRTALVLVRDSASSPKRLSPQEASYCGYFPEPGCLAFGVDDDVFTVLAIERGNPPVASPDGRECAAFLQLQCSRSATGLTGIGTKRYFLVDVSIFTDGSASLRFREGDNLRDDTETFHSVAVLHGDVLAPVWKAVHDPPRGAAEVEKWFLDAIAVAAELESDWSDKVPDMCLFILGHCVKPSDVGAVREIHKTWSVS